MNCSGGVDESAECMDRFSDCSDSLQEQDDWKGLPLPEVPGLNLQSLGDTTTAFSSCILLYYNCSESLTSCRLMFNNCQRESTIVRLQDVDVAEFDKNIANSTPQDKIISAPAVTPEISVTVTVTTASQNDEPVSISSNTPKNKFLETGDVKTPSLAQGSGKIPEIQCTWSFFMCKKSSAQCKKEHSDCLNGDVFDNKICAGVAKNPQRYLVPHPTDCTKFYSCQRNGWGGWIANLMDCPITTGFDRTLMICNYINKLPRCQDDMSAKYAKSDQSLSNGLIAKQTQQQLQLEVGEIGYLAATLDSSGGLSVAICNVTFVIVLSLLSMIHNL